jgi:hypothetical protein
VTWETRGWLLRTQCTRRSLPCRSHTRSCRNAGTQPTPRGRQRAFRRHRTPPHPRRCSPFSGCAGVASYGIEEHLLQPQPPIFSAFLALLRTFRLTSARRVSDAAATSMRPRAHRCGMRCRLSACHTLDGEAERFHARGDVRGSDAPELVERPRPQNGRQIGASFRSAGPQVNR